MACGSGGRSVAPAPAPAPAQEYAPSPPPQVQSRGPELVVVPPRGGIDQAARGVPNCMAVNDPGLTQPIPAANMDARLLDRAVLNYTNIARCQQGLRPLQDDGALTRTAQGHSRDMVAQRFFSHTSPIPQKRKMVDRLKLENVRFQAAAENIATAKRLEMEAGVPVYPLGGERCRFSLSPQGTPLRFHTYDSLARELVQRWMESPGHRRNILNPEYSRHGAAGAIDPNERLCEGVIATQLFAG